MTEICGLTEDEGGGGGGVDTGAADLRPRDGAHGVRGVHTIGASRNYAGVGQQLGRSQGEGNEENANHLKKEK